jgi:hydroxyquinol 1,2-dioxygenase
MNDAPAKPDVVTYDEANLTEAVLARIGEKTDPRFRAVMQSLVRHLHGFVRETRLTQAEWEQAIGFITRVGKMCDDRRQEVILLSDTLGVSMLVDALAHAGDARATPSTVLGPFHRDGAPRLGNGADLAAGFPGEKLLVDVAVTDLEGRPLPGAAIDVWQASAQGAYDSQMGRDLLPDKHEHALRGTFHADAQGRVHFRTVMPSSYPVPTDGPVGAMLAAMGRHAMRPAHIHFWLRAPGHRPLITHVFVAGDPYLDQDAVFGVKAALVVACAKGTDGVRRMAYSFALAPLQQGPPQGQGK